MQEKSKKIFKSKTLLLISIFLIVVGITIIMIDICSKSAIENNEKKALEEFYVSENISEDNIEIQEEVKEKKSSQIEYIGVLKIPKIKLERGLVDPKSKLNSIKYNVTFLKESDMPDVSNGNVILAAHSGNSQVSFFKNLYKLGIDDELTIEYNHSTYKYRVVNTYEIEKTGKAKIIRNKNVNTLTLITCMPTGNNQLVVISELE